MSNNSGMANRDLAQLKELLGDQLANVRKLIVLGVGAVFCNDDAAGMICLDHLALALPEREDILLLGGSSAPENFTGVIADFAPDLLLFVDAADIGRPIGTVAVIPAEQIDGITFCTHMLPLPVMLQYLANRCPEMRPLLLGIQPADTGQGTDVHPAVRAAAEALGEALAEVIERGMRR